MLFLDQLKREISLKKTPKRIVCLVPSITELLVDLGLKESIVGVTKFCVHPIYIKQTKTIVGGTKNIKLEKIKELLPDIILCNKEENTKDIVDSCQKIASTHVSEIYTIADVIDLIHLYGEIFSIKREAKNIIHKINYTLNDFKNFVKEKDVLKVAYFIWRKPWMVAANNTFINHLLELSKFENIYANKKRYPEIELKKIRLEGESNLIFLSSEPYPFKEEHAFEISKHTTNTKTIFVDGEMFSWYGTRLLKAFDYFKKLRNRV